jgi:mannose-6-phosphate isomerase-like protein (cupin superfamily)
MIHKGNSLESEVRAEMRGGKGSVAIRHFFKPGEIKAKCRLCSRLILPPGASIGPHKHETEDELFIIERGVGILDDGRNRTKVEPGDAILTGNGESHSISNEGKEPLEIIAVIMCY